MNNLIISTVGTSLLTNRIDRANPQEKYWYNQLRDSANQNQQSISSELKKICDKLKERAYDLLIDYDNQNQIEKLRAASAELNGIYGFYNNNIQLGQRDIHWLIATDTYQGQLTAEVIKDFLKYKDLTIDFYSPINLSTENSQKFSEGIDNLINWLESFLPEYQNYHVCFNLVGGFKVLQGYLDILGMFYADEIIYVFEGSGSPIIKIPRLPIKIDDSQIKSQLAKFALMEQGQCFTLNQLPGIYESLLKQARPNLRRLWAKYDVPYVIGEEVIDTKRTLCETSLIICSWCLIVLFFPFSLFVTLKIVQEYERAVILRLGRILPGTLIH